MRSSPGQGPRQQRYSPVTKLVSSWGEAQWRYTTGRPVYAPEPLWVHCSTDQGAFRQPVEPHLIYHNGPGQAYLSRSAGTDVRNHKGDGDWFKIASLGPVNDTWWSTRDQTGMNFTIPAATPPGQYLLRVEHLYVRYPVGTTQFYIACAQLDVRPPRGGGVIAKIPGSEHMVRFPGAYQLRDEGK